MAETSHQHLCGSNPFPAHIRTIGLVAPAGIPDPARLRAGMSRLESWGLRLVTDSLILEPERFFAAADRQRQAALVRAFADPRVDALLAVRGGYGCARLLPGLDWGPLIERQLPLIGYSDLTALHLAAYGAGSRSQIFGPMVSGDFARAPADAAEREQLAGVFASLGRAFSPVFGDYLGDAPLVSLRCGTALGPLVPANLAVLTSLIGTPFLPDLRGCVLLVEDINEAAYRVDRCLNQLVQAGVLPGLSGLVFGQFSACEDAHWLPEVFRDVADTVSGPAAVGLPFGHAFPSLALPVGAPVCLAATPAGAQLTWGVAG